MSLNMEIIKTINYIFIGIFLLSYLYQLFIMYFIKMENIRKYKKNKFAVLIAARNEESVIGNLIESIKLQNYPSELIDIFVVADNCTDSTASIAREKGANVIERFNKEHVGKGYALDYLIKAIKNEYKYNEYDGFFVFDADNLVDENFVLEMNKIYERGYEVITCYRSSKNYENNWISAGSSLLFFSYSIISRCKMLINSSCKISGTGFLISKKILEFYGGWKFHLLAEDTEISFNNIINGIKVGYSDLSIIYDEQPVKFSQFWKQRVRWTRGYIQVLKEYMNKFKNIKIQNKYIPDTITIATLLITINFISIIVLSIIACFNFDKGIIYLENIIKLFIVSYSIVFTNGLITSIIEWNRIKAPRTKKIKYLFTFPLLLMCYVPIPFICLFAKNIKWEAIKHTNTKNIRMMK